MIPLEFGIVGPAVLERGLGQKACGLNRGNELSCAIGLHENGSVGYICRTYKVNEIALV